MTDPETLVATEEVALLKLRIGQLVQRLQTGDSGSLWSDLQQAHQSLTSAIHSGDQAAFQTALSHLGSVIHRGADAEQAWVELYDAIERKTKAAAREHKRMIDMQAVITADKALALIHAVMSSVAQHVTDTKARARIAGDIKLLINRPLPVETTEPPAAEPASGEQGEANA